MSRGGRLTSHHHQSYYLYQPSRRRLPTRKKYCLAPQFPGEDLRIYIYIYVYIYIFIMYIYIYIYIYYTPLCLPYRFMKTLSIGNIVDFHEAVETYKNPQSLAI